MNPSDDRCAPRGAPRPASGVSRRGFLKGAGLSVAGMGLLGSAASADQEEAGSDTLREIGPGPVPVDLTVNGKPARLNATPATTLLDAVREQLDLTGAKRVCDRGSCGACSMIVDDRLVNACTFLAVDAAGKRVRTIEGLAVDGKLSPLQQAFVDADALQCGFCTPGFVMACTALIERNPKPTREQMASELAGNLCRCGTYPNIFQAIERVAKGGAR